MGILGIYVRTSVDSDSTSIEQQKEEGVKFCEKMKFGTPNFYEDVGISGFDVDKNNPFKKLSGLKKLLDDIENRIVDKVWMWEHSRSSRDKFLSYYSNEIFKKYKIIIYEKGKEIDLNIPETEFLQDILTGYSILERNKIVERTRRGVYYSINNGIRGFRELYGYKKNGKDEKGYTIWIPVDSEIKKIRYLYEKYLEGNSINSIVIDLFKKVSRNQLRDLSRRWSVIIRKFVYTGYNMTTEGLELYNKFKKGEINSIKELNNKKYYVKSVQFPIELVSIDDWINIIEKLQSNSHIYKNNNRRRENSEIITGIVQCPYCELKYYCIDDKGYLYYKHYSNKGCKQKPKSVKVDKLNNLFEVFFFYFYLVYDDTKVLIEESQKLIKINQSEIKEKIKKIDSENKEINEQINNFKSIYKNTKDIKKLDLIIEKEIELKNEKEINNNSLSQLKYELEELQNKFDKDKLELTYYDVKETVVNFFEKLNNEEKRLLLIKIIKYCQLFGKYIVIDTGKLLFVFNIDKENILPEVIYNKFKKDKHFKDNFLNSSNVIDNEGDFTEKIWELIGTGVNSKDYRSFEKTLQKKYTQKQIDNSVTSLVNHILIRKLSDIVINEYYLKHSLVFDLKTIMEQRLDRLGIKYDLSGIEKIISFTEL